MPAKISFTQKEQAAVEEAIAVCQGNEAIHLQKLLDKMKSAREKETTKFHGVGVAKVLDMARDKFGDRFKTPSNITKEWTIKMQSAINAAGVDEKTAQAAVDNCDWKGDIFAQTFIYKMAELAVVKTRQTKLFTAGPPAPSKKSGWLGRLGDNDED